MSAPFNPYAFPSHGSMGEVVQEGMSLRDYFAAKALAALIAEPVEGVEASMAFELSDGSCELFAGAAYKMADAMLKARQK